MYPDLRDRVVFAYLEEPPFCSLRSDGVPVGCDIEVAALVLSAIGVRLVEYKRVTFAELLPGVANGKWHVNTPLFVTQERTQLVAFNRPTWALGDGLLMLRDNPKRFASYAELAADRSVKVAIVTGQVQGQAALAAGLSHEQLIEVVDQPMAVEAILKGYADAYVSVAMAHRGYLQMHPNIRLTAIEFAETTVPAFGAYSFALDATDLREAFDRELGYFLGGVEHLEIMRRHGFTGSDLRGIAS